MTDWKREFLESSLLGQEINKNDSNAVISRCIRLAYRDMLTAGRFYSKLFPNDNDKEYICSTTLQSIKDSNYKFSRDLISNTSHLFCTDTEDRIGKDNRYVTGYGLAQKFINMTYKYLYVFSERIFDNKDVPDFSSCDCPLDSIILKNDSIKGSVKRSAWSKLTEKEYKEIQDKISDELKNDKDVDDELRKLGNLAFDFLSWGNHQ